MSSPSGQGAPGAAGGHREARGGSADGPRVAGPLVLVTGATGFVGRALVPALAAGGWRVRAATRRLRPGLDSAAEWVELDLRHPAGLAAALAGVRAAFHLVHGMASAQEDYAEEERLGAAAFARQSVRAGVERIVYLGGVAPRGRPSRHLASRLAVGEILRLGPVPAIELRASMIIGAGSASWRIVRDLALRLPAMILPSWTESRTCPVAIDDVIRALVDALDLPLRESAWYDIPGPETLTVREIMARTAALRGRRLPGLRVPFPSPRLSSLWLKLVSDADWRIVRELVLGLSQDLLPRDDRYWTLTRHGPLIGFDEAARRALAADPPQRGVRGGFLSLEEALVDLLAPRLGAGAADHGRDVRPAARSRR